MRSQGKLLKTGVAFGEKEGNHCNLMEAGWKDLAKLTAYPYSSQNVQHTTFAEAVLVQYGAPRAGRERQSLCERYPSTT